MVARDIHEKLRPFPEGVVRHYFSVLKRFGILVTLVILVGHREVLKILKAGQPDGSQTAFLWVWLGLLGVGAVRVVMGLFLALCVRSRGQILLHEPMGLGTSEELWVESRNSNRWRVLPPHFAWINYLLVLTGFLLGFIGGSAPHMFQLPVVSLAILSAATESVILLRSSLSLAVQEQGVG